MFHFRRSVLGALALALLGACSAETTPGAGPPLGAAGASASDCAEASREEVSADNRFGTLHGTLTLPARCAPVPAVLIIAGSGPTDRDGNDDAGLQTDMYRLLAEGLAERGVASLRYDKAGARASRAAAPASPADFRFEMLADDAALLLRILRADPRVSRVIVVGHSEGALVGLLAARQEPIDGYASIAGAGRPVNELIREQLRNQLPAADFEQANHILSELEAGRLVSELPASVPVLARVFSPSAQPYLISWMQFDPTRELSELAAPASMVSIAQGTTDIQVSTLDAELLAAARPDAQLLLIEGMNHVLKFAGADLAEQQRAYTDPTLPVVSELIEHLAELALR